MRNLDDDVYRALRVMAARNNRRTEAEVCDILAKAVKPEGRLRMGDALFALGREVGLTNASAEATDRSRHRFDSVWDAIENTAEEAENMKLRSTLLTALKNHLQRSGITQTEAAKLFGVTQPRVSDLMRGKISLFSIDALVTMVSAAGLHIEMLVLGGGISRQGEGERGLGLVRPAIDDVDGDERAE
ncbi:XRE family transcriptional regulator [Allohahella marinimesophila]|uniref:XRE family transcriptional regulator n=1 Tax=Allohahella marinimesophila TaxID=1054972 RepID=UPI0031DCC4D7